MNRRLSWPAGFSVLAVGTLQIVAVILPCLPAAAVNEALVKRKPDGNRSDAVHRIPIYDFQGVKISVDDKLVLPFSTRNTCGECHDYGKIRSGWHFSAASTGTVAGRPGEPWILADARTFTQLPVSSRDWKGAWRPGDAGLTPWRFVKAFGAYMPGGGLGEIAEGANGDAHDLESRWDLAGRLEIDCLGCHSGSPLQDQSEWAAQIGRENFQWAATAASGLAYVRGGTSGLPSTYDIFSGPLRDDPSVGPPSVEYNPALFDSKNRAFFDILGRPSNNRCYFCHSSKLVGGEKWEQDQDVHLAAGLSCVDCHRNDISHQIVRGYGGEAAKGAKAPSIATLSCEGCHLGVKNPTPAAPLSTPSTSSIPSVSSPDTDLPLPGRLGAPRPLHKGLPPVHLQRMTCTACHSGPWPEKEARQTRTARANRLGVHTAASSDDGLPYIATPVFMRQADGKTAPHNVVWPAFWGRLSGDTVKPLLPDKVSRIAGEILRGRDNGTTGTEAILTEWKVTKALAAIKNGGVTTQTIAKASNEKAHQTTGASSGEPVFISGGKMWLLGAGGKLAAADNAAAKPYAWPIAHDVRPAGRSLGARACEDCHAPGAPFYFGKVKALGPLRGEEAAVSTMGDFFGKAGVTYVRTSQFFKWLIIVTMTLLILHILGDLTRRALREKGH